MSSGRHNGKSQVLMSSGSLRCISARYRLIVNACSKSRSMQQKHFFSDFSTLTPSFGHFPFLSSISFRSAQGRQASMPVCTRWPHFQKWTFFLRHMVGNWLGCRGWERRLLAYCFVRLNMRSDRGYHVVGKGKQ